jgi:hypothetical protein
MCNAAYAQMAQVAIGAIGQSRQASSVRRNARFAESDALWGLHDQQVQIDAQATDTMVDRSRQVMMQAGHLNALFADSGLSGNTQDRIAAVTGMQADADLTTIERNRANKQNQTNNETAAIRARTQSTINGAKGPSLLGTGLQIAAVYANAKDKEKR